MNIPRPLYLQQIEPYIDTPMVKILVGIRRAGKSSLLKQMKEILLARGVAEGQIIQINFEDLEHAEVREKGDFITLIRPMIADKRRYYILLDEVQLVEGWEEVVNGLLASNNVDIYITGSNARLLSTEISTVLTGRYINIPVQTLSFKEALEFKEARGLKRGSLAEEFANFQQKGGFPILHALDYALEDGDKAVSDIYTSIIYRDLIERKNIRNTELLGRIIRYIFDNVGNIFSANSIADYLKNELRSLDPETIYNYLEWLEEVFVIHKVSRYDLRGKALLRTQEKYYLGDVGLLYALNGRKDSYSSGVLENTIYLELVSRGYQVYIGKNKDREIDFVAEKRDKKFYLQVALHLYEPETYEREYAAFNGIDDNYPKYVLTLDEGEDERNGIRKRFLPEFLLSGEL